MCSSYRWRLQYARNCDFSKIDPAPVQEELERIRVERGGVLRPQDVVDEAASKDSVLHDLFVWDDTKGAALFRRLQATTIIGNIMVLSEQGREYPQHVSISVESDVPEGDQANEPQGRQPKVYQRIDIAASDPDEWAGVVFQYAQRLSAAQQSLNRLKNYAEDCAADARYRERIAPLARAAAALETARSEVSRIH